MSHHDLYNHPLWYDAAANWDLTSVADQLDVVLHRHAPLSLSHTLLLPACGTGRYARAMSARGWQVIGYDRSRPMLRVARQRSPGFWAQADLRDFTMAVRFDCAATMAHSFAYLLTDHDVRAHLIGTARLLKPGGVYVLHLQFAFHGQPSPEPPWHATCGTLHVTTSWDILTEDHHVQRARHRCRMTVTEEDGTKHMLDEIHTMRLWTPRSLRAMIRSSGMFDIIAVYDEVGGRHQLRDRLHGGMGLCMVILRATSQGRS